MRWIHITIIAVFVIVTLIFAIENLEIVVMSFLGFSARVPLALLVAIIYIVGMVTGSSLLALLRRSVQGARRSTIQS